MEQTNQNPEFSNSITLLNGTTLPLFLKPEHPSKILPDAFRLDTTGQYLTIGNYKPRIMKESEEAEIERQYNHHLFTENAWFLLDHAEEIFSDSRMFLAPVKVQNGLAYTGTSGFTRPTIGVYLEWWLNFKESAVDASGNLVWYISGSPLSGRNCCCSVTPEGKQVKMDQATSFSKVWGTFMKTNTRYNEEKQIAEVYSLEEVLIKLRGEGYRLRMVELKHEMVYQNLKFDFEKLKNRFKDLSELFSKRLAQNKKMQLTANKDLILAFAHSYFEVKKQYDIAHREYSIAHRELKQRLHRSTLNGDYKALLSQASKESRLLRSRLTDMGNNFMHAYFSHNPNEITLKDVLNYAKSILNEL